jgi:hypothetical protein
MNYILNDKKNHKSFEPPLGLHINMDTFGVFNFEYFLGLIINSCLQYAWMVVHKWLIDVCMCD